MSDDHRDGDGGALQAIAASRGVTLPADDGAHLARQSAALLERFRALAAELCADDDVLAFHRMLEAEARRG